MFMEPNGSFLARLYRIAIAIISSRKATLQELLFNGRKNRKKKTMTRAYLMLYQNRTDKFYFLKNFIFILEDMGSKSNYFSKLF